MSAGQGTFAGSGAVGRYWQTRCRGFEVRSARGRRLGTVEALELDRETRAVAVLLVRCRRWRGRRTLRVQPELVSAVDPWQRSLVVVLPGRPSRSVTAGSGLARGVRGSALRAAAIAHCVRRRAPPAWRALVWSGRRALLAAGLAAWLYAVVVFTLVRVAVFIVRAVTAGTARGGARLGPYIHGAE